MPKTNTKPKRNTNIKPSAKNASGLYQSVKRNPRNYRPNYYTVGDTTKTVTAYDRYEQIKLGRSLFTQCPELGGALLQKTSWVVGPGAFSPIYTGTNEKWGDEVEEWLTQQFFPVCSTLGTNYPFSKILSLSSLALDVDGDTGLILTSTPSGFPQVGLVASHRIGQRNPNDKLVKSGKFEGYRTFDGVIINDLGRSIGYNILGDTAEDDVQISTQNLQLLMESEFCDQLRGISRIARSITDWANQDEINEFLLRGVKLASSIGLLHKTESGDGSDTGFPVGAEEDALAPGNSAVQITPVNGGEIYFMKAAANESIESLKDERPSQNTEAFIQRIQKRAMYSIGWPQEMLDASKLGGASVRLVQDLVRRSIADRQATIERRAKLIVTYAVAKAMKSGLISRNDTDWYKWNFTKSAQITVDSGNEQNALREGFKLGTVSLQDIASVKGQDWYELRNQSQKETEDLLDRATVISKKYSISLDSAITLLSQRTPNQAPITNNVDNAPISVTTEE